MHIFRPSLQSASLPPLPGEPQADGEAIYDETGEQCFETIVVLSTPVQTQTNNRREIGIKQLVYTKLCFSCYLGLNCPAFKTCLSSRANLGKMHVSVLLYIISGAVAK